MKLPAARPLAPDETVRALAATAGEHHRSF
jgi:hypothetical protein